jgi:hypothetical protein
LKDQSVDGRIMLKWTFKNSDGRIDWIDLAQDWDRWRAIVNTMMNLQVPYNAGNFLNNLGCFSFSGKTLPHGFS